MSGNSENPPLPGVQCADRGVPVDLGYLGHPVGDAGVGVHEVGEVAAAKEAVVVNEQPG